MNRLFSMSHDSHDNFLMNLVLIITRIPNQKGFLELYVWNIWMIDSFVIYAIDDGKAGSFCSTMNIKYITFVHAESFWMMPINRLVCEWQSCDQLQVSVSLFVQDPFTTASLWSILNKDTIGVIYGFTCDIIWLQCDCHRISKRGSFCYSP